MDTLPNDLESFEAQYDVTPQRFVTVRAAKPSAMKSVAFNSTENQAAKSVAFTSTENQFKSSRLTEGIKNNFITRKVGSFLTRKKKDNISEGARSTVEFFRSALGNSQHGMVIKTAEDIEREKEKDTVPFFIVHPYNTKRIAWDILSMCLLFYSIVTVPVKIAFPFDEECSTQFWEQRWHWYTDLLVDFAFILDVFVNLRTAYWHPHQKSVLVVDAWSIFLNYLRGFLIFDLVSAVPMDLILLPYCEDGSRTSSSANSLARTPAFIKRLRLLRVIRLLRMARIRRLLERVRDTMHINPGVLRLIKFAFFVCIVAHYDACIFFWIGELERDQEPGQSWTANTEKFLSSSEVEKVHDMEISGMYTVSLYWAATTLTTVGFGDITPVTTWEFGFCMLVIIQGGVALGYVIGSMADMLSRLNMRKKRHLDKMEYWESAFHRGNFPPPLRRKIRNHHEYVFLNRISKLPEFAEAELSRSLLRDITAHIYKDALGSLPMFRGLSDEVITELALALEHVQLPPGETLYKEGDEGDCMYFLQRGDVQLTMLLMSTPKKRALSPHELSEFVERVGETVSHHELLRTGSTTHHAQPAELSDVKTYADNSNIAKYQVRVGNLRCAAFKWSINQSTCSYFGESVLFSGDRRRLSSAVTVTGCTLLVLTQRAMEFVCRKYPSMREVSRRMGRHARPKLVSWVDRVVHTLRSRGDVQCRLYVTVHEGANMPKMDNYGGRCDAYATVDVGQPRPGKLTFQTLKVYNTYNPRWNECFAFPVKDVYSPGSVMVNLSLFDWDLVGEHDFIGQIHVDLAEAAKVAWELGKEERYAPHWYNLTQTVNGKLKGVKGYNRKQSRVKLSFRMVPPPGGKLAAARRCSQESHPSLGGTVPVPLRATSAPNRREDCPPPEPPSDQGRQRSSSMVIPTHIEPQEPTPVRPHSATSPVAGLRTAGYQAEAAQRLLPAGEAELGGGGVRYSILEASSAQPSRIGSPFGSAAVANNVSAPPSIPDIDSIHDTMEQVASMEVAVFNRGSVGKVQLVEDREDGEIEGCSSHGVRPDDGPDSNSFPELRSRARREMSHVEEADEHTDDVEELRKTLRKLRESARIGWGTVESLVSKFQDDSAKTEEDANAMRDLLSLMRSMPRPSAEPEARDTDKLDDDVINQVMTVTESLDS